MGPSDQRDSKTPGLSTYNSFMCGRYTLHHTREVLSSHFGVEFKAFKPRYNLTPTELVHFKYLSKRDC
jgi:hypothetical protein